MLMIFIVVVAVLVAGVVVVIFLASVVAVSVVIVYSFKSLHISPQYIQMTKRNEPPLLQASATERRAEEV